jgi:hypothetical protein
MRTKDNKIQCSITLDKITLERLQHIQDRFDCDLSVSAAVRIAVAEHYRLTTPEKSAA